MPAILKGMFDRMWLPGFAFSFDKKTHAVKQRLKGKSARIITLSGTHSPFVMWVKFGDFTNELTRGILGFSGINAQVTNLGPCERQSKHAHQNWLKLVEVMGRQGK